MSWEVEIPPSPFLPSFVSSPLTPSLICFGRCTVTPVAPLHIVSAMPALLRVHLSGTGPLVCTRGAELQTWMSYYPYPQRVPHLLSANHV